MVHRVIKRNQNGFSQIQVLMAVLVVGGLAFAYMQFSENKNNQPQSLALETEAVDVAKVIRERLAAKQTCEANFVGMTPGDSLSALHSSTNINDKAIAEVAVKFQASNIYIKEIRLLNRAEEVSSGFRESSKAPIIDLTTGSSVVYLKVVMVKHLNNQKKAEKVYVPKEFSETFAVKGFFYDVKIVSHPDVTKLKEVCQERGLSLGMNCKGVDQSKCATLPIDQDGKGTDFVVDAKTGGKFYLAECRYYRAESPLMECSI